MLRMLESVKTNEFMASSMSLSAPPNPTLTDLCARNSSHTADTDAHRPITHVERVHMLPVPPSPRSLTSRLRHSQPRVPEEHTATYSE